MFQMGDFYEMFFEDANVASPLLGIALTSRNKNKEDSVPMCGVPLSSLGSSVKKLLENNLKVAVCKQVENSLSVQGLVKREVTKLLTPGMVFDPETLDSTRQNYLSCFDDKTVSFVDVSTGENFYSTIEYPNQVQNLFDIFKPVELVVTKDQKNTNTSNFKKLLVSEFDQHQIPNSDKVKYTDKGIEIESTKTLIGYIESMGHSASSLKDLSKHKLNYMQIPSSSIEHLEIFKTYNAQTKGSLFYAINKTKTPGGARKLREFLNFPLIQKDTIIKRHNKIQEYLSNTTMLNKLRKSLSGVGEIARKVTKLCTNNYTPRDMVLLAQSLSAVLEVFEISKIEYKHKAKLQKIVDSIFSTIEIDFLGNIKDGGFIKPESSKELSSLIECDRNAAEKIKSLESEQRRKTGIPSLKVKFNNVFRYYIEITNVHKSKVPDYYTRKQTLVNSERYTIPELKNLEEEALLARSKKLDLELEILKDLKNLIQNNTDLLMDVSDLISRVDVFTSLAWLALEYNYVKPELTQDEICVVNLRHPVVELYSEVPFVPNTFEINRSDIMMITGPNMAGKSTAMRQFALCSILCQMGSFVPASSAKLPIFDKVYTRIGASDLLSEGLSTFMVEMKETASMLSEATCQSLLVLDEIGRGTSTFDGMSLAQAILEYLVFDVKATALFATHYHELTTSSDKVINKHMGIEETQKGIKFLYTLIDGVCDKSYGIEVAKLAGIPAKVTDRASKILESKTTMDVSGHNAMVKEQQSKSTYRKGLDDILNDVLNTDITNTTPVEALVLVNKLKQKLDKCNTS